MTRPLLVCAECMATPQLCECPKSVRDSSPLVDLRKALADRGWIRSPERAS